MSDFFDTETPLPEDVESFDEFGLSHPIRRALQKMDKITTPTPVQCKTIPIALQGKDVCASSLTGTGKTLAFLIPTVERLLRAGENEGLCRAVVLSPTRELAQQTFSVLLQLSRFTNISEPMLLTGGSIKPHDEEEKLRNGPDFIVATPGRLVDHIKNCEGFSLEGVMCFVLDEADKLLQEGFQSQIEEIHNALPETVQTLLVTATMTSPVTRLAEMALNHPVRIEMDDIFKVSKNLKQEFVRCTNENRNAMLVAICSRITTKRTMIFANRKKVVHYLYVLFKALGMPVAALEGNMSDLRRREALALFVTGKVEFLIATDVAGRGLDIKGVQNVVNYNMPESLTKYLHRVGRTARIGNEGKTIAFITEEDKDLMKNIITRSMETNPVTKRVVPADVIEITQKRIDEVGPKIEEILEEERELIAINQGLKDIERTKEIVANPMTALDARKREFVDKNPKDARDASRMANKIKGMKAKMEKKGKKFDGKKKGGKFSGKKGRK